MTLARIIAVLTLLYGILRPLAGQRPAPLSAEDFVVANVHPGTDSTALREQLGAPDSIRADKNLPDSSARIVRWIYPHFTVHFFSTDYVGAIWTKDSAIATTRGLRVGDSAKRVQDLYGMPSGCFQNDCVFEDPSELHVIRITTKSGHVTEIYVGSILD